MGKRSRKKLTPNQLEYNKQIRRIKQIIYRAEKSGYRFDEDVLPNKPSKVTKKFLKELQGITAKKVQDKGYFLDTETGEIVESSKHRQQVYKERARKAKETRERKKQLRENIERFNELTITNDIDTSQHKYLSDKYNKEGEYYPSFSRIVINNYQTHINQFNEVCADLLTQWLNKLINSHGEDKVAQMLNEGAENGLIVTYKIAYDNSKLTQYMSEMLNYLPEVDDMFREYLMDAMEEYEDWNDEI